MLIQFASVNIHEEGAGQVIRLLLDRRVGVKAGIWNVRSTETLLSSSLADKCLQILIEPAEEAGDAKANLERIEATLGRVGRRVFCTVSGHRPGILLSWRRCVTMTRAWVSRTR